MSGSVSENRCFLMSPTQVADGEGISMRTQLPTGVWLHFRGTVAYRLGDGFGVTFGTMTYHTRKVLSGLLKEHHERTSGMGGGRLLMRGDFPRYTATWPDLLSA